MKTSAELVSLTAPFRDRTMYHRTGLVLLNDLASGWLPAIAGAMPADRIDWVARVVDELRPDQRWVTQDPDEILQDLRGLARGPAPFAGRIVEGLDFVIARWERAQVVRFWTKFISLDKQSEHALLIVMPPVAFLGPEPEELGILENEGRVLRLN